MPSAKKTRIHDEKSPLSADAPEWRQLAELYLERGTARPDLVQAASYLYEWKTANEQKTFYHLTKSLFDRTLAAAALTALSPFFAAIGALIFATTGSNPFFTQIRIGQYGRPFRIFKFRTMVDGTKRTIFFETNAMSGAMFKDPNDLRITRLGRMLRRWSIDELPQLINILKGDMSFVGPRPLSIEDSCVIPEDCMVRFAAVPGLTGHWQATARDNLDGFHKLRLDAEYVVFRGWKADLTLMLKTIPTVVKGTGAW